MVKQANQSTDLADFIILFVVILCFIADDGGYRNRHNVTRELKNIRNLSLN